jgi:DnaB-like helicase N terminal domain
MEKLIPQNIEAEQSLLGSVIIDPEAFDLVADKLRADDFYRDAHCRLTHKFAKRGRYASREENGEDMRQILIICSFLAPAKIGCSNSNGWTKSVWSSVSAYWISVASSNRRVTINFEDCPSFLLGNVFLTGYS